MFSKTPNKEVTLESDQSRSTISLGSEEKSDDKMDLLQSIKQKLSDNKNTNKKISDLRSRFESVLKSNLSNSFEEEEDYFDN